MTLSDTCERCGNLLAFCRCGARVVPRVMMPEAHFAEPAERTERDNPFAKMIEQAVSHEVDILHRELADSFGAFRRELSEDWAKKCEDFKNRLIGELHNAFSHRIFAIDTKLELATARIELIERHLFGSAAE